jgi:hypothetical protein
MWFVDECFPRITPMCGKSCLRLDNLRRRGEITCLNLHNSSTKSRLWILLKPDLASRKAAMPPSLSWKFTEKEFTGQVKDLKLFVKCIQAITLNHSPLLCGIASLREISMSDFRILFSFS